MRKKAAVILAAWMTMSTSILAFAADSIEYPPVENTGTAKVSINGQTVKWTGMEPVNVSGTVFVPIREALEAFGQRVTWSGQKPQIVETEDPVTGLQVTFDTGSQMVETSQLGIQRTLEMNDAPKVMSEKTMISIRALTEVYGKVVSYDVATATVSVRDYNEDDEVYALKSTETYDGYIGDVVKIHYTSDGTYDYQPTANKDFMYLGKEAEGVGNYSMYFKAMNVNKEASILVNQVKGGKVADVRTYKMAIQDPVETAVLLTSDQKNPVKKGQYVKVVLPEQAASTGYEWAATERDSGLAQVKKISEKPTVDMPGAPNNVIFVFKVTAVGESSVTFSKSRAWEDTTDEKTIETVKFTVDAN